MNTFNALALLTLNPDADLVGLGFAKGPKGLGTYWTMVLAKADWYPVVIDNEAPSTDRDEVGLYLYGKGLAQKVRLTNGAAGGPSGSRSSRR